MTREAARPANRLLELDIPLEGGWRPVEKINDVQELEKREGRSGGHFSAGYIVRNEEGRVAFLKAMDYERALRSTSPTPSEVIIEQAQAYNFEKDMAAKCTLMDMNFIVRYLGAGTVHLAENEPVEYIIFEKAEGDIRAGVSVDKAFSQVWAFRTLHHAVSGLYELHRERMAHQDVKPSNLLVTKAEGRGREFEMLVVERHRWIREQRIKLSDLGSLSIEGEECPTDSRRWAGDATYSPLELLYGQEEESWQRRRIGCDLYMLGTLAFFLCTDGANLNLEILQRLPKEHWPPVFEGGWDGTYENIQPHIQTVFSEVVKEAEAGIVPRFRGVVIRTVNELCHPDPSRRGWRGLSWDDRERLSVERYRSLFGNLARQATLARDGDRRLGGGVRGDGS